jgi:hypothetical protein
MVILHFDAPERTTQMIHMMLILLAAGWTTLAAPPEVEQDTATGLVNATARFVRENYVFPDRAAAIEAQLRQSLAAGRYRGLDGPELAARLTEDLQAVTQDKHMNVKHNPAQARELATGGPGGPGPAGNAYMAEMMARSNYGVPELRALPGKIRYINLAPAFLWDPNRSPQVLDDAMRFLSGGEAYIIDIRQNGGGNPAGVRYVISHFMPPGEKLMTYRMGPSGTSEIRTISVPAGVLPEKPLYVLIGPQTASASEEFAAHVKNFKLGTLVGATTAGAGHRNALFGTPDGFVVSVSVGTALHPVTNAGWEGTGVAPDISVPPAEALAAAERDAAERLAQQPSPPPAGPPAPPAPAAPGPAAQSAGRTPRPEVIQIAQAIVEAVNGSDDAVDRLVEGHFSAEYRALRPIEERRRWFQPLREKLGTMTPTGLQRRAEDTFIIVAEGGKNVTLHLVVTHDPSYRITGLAVEEPRN